MKNRTRSALSATRVKLDTCSPLLLPATACSSDSTNASLLSYIMAVANDSITHLLFVSPYPISESN